MNKILSVLLILVVASCVSSKKYNQLSGNFKDSEIAVQSLKEQNQKLTVQNTELQSKLDRLTAENKLLADKVDEYLRSIEMSASKNKQLQQGTAS